MNTAILALQKYQIKGNKGKEQTIWVNLPAGRQVPRCGGIMLQGLP